LLVSGGTDGKLSGSGGFGGARRYDNIYAVAGRELKEGKEIFSAGGGTGVVGQNAQRRFTIGGRCRDFRSGRNYRLFGLDGRSWRRVLDRGNHGLNRFGRRSWLGGEFRNWPWFG